jgi:hypothetical protein
MRPSTERSVLFFFFFLLRFAFLLTVSSGCLCGLAAGLPCLEKVSVAVHRERSGGSPVGALVSPQHHCELDLGGRLAKSRSQLCKHLGRLNNHSRAAHGEWERMGWGPLVVVSNQSASARLGRILTHNPSFIKELSLIGTLTRRSVDVLSHLVIVSVPVSAQSAFRWLALSFPTANMVAAVENTSPLPVAFQQRTPFQGPDR